MSKKLELLKAGVWFSYASNIQRKLSVVFFFLKVQSVKSNCVYLSLCAVTVLRWVLVGLTVLGSTV